MNKETQKAVAELREAINPVCPRTNLVSGISKSEANEKFQSLITAFTAELEAQKRESEAALATLRANHVTDMRVTNESAHFHILECKRLREELEAAQLDKPAPEEKK